MPSLPKRPCAQFGCGVLVNSGRCAKHRLEKEAGRGTTAERGYGADWQRVRAVKLADSPICEIRTHCQGNVATEVDHIQPIHRRPELRLEWSNLQSACKPCNSAKRDRENGGKTRRKVSNCVESSLDPDGSFV